MKNINVEKKTQEEKRENKIPIPKIIVQKKFCFLLSKIEIGLLLISFFHFKNKFKSRTSSTFGVSSVIISNILILFIISIISKINSEIIINPNDSHNSSYLTLRINEMVKQKLLTMRNVLINILQCQIKFI